MKRLVSLFITLCVIISTLTIPASASNTGLENFKPKNTYTQGQYIDVPTTNTFARNVQTAFEYGIMQGYGSTFGISDSITRLASIIIACRLNCIYYYGADNISSTYSGTTQEMYLAYAKDHGIYTSFSDFSTPATRSEFAAILSSSLPDEALSPVNTIQDNMIPDVSSSTTYASQIYRLYRAGIINGSDAKGTFYPTATITRGAACAIATRMAIPSLRKTFSLSVANPSTALSAEEIYAKCSPAVFYIEIYNAAGKAIASGSGFFIDSNGTAVTNYHVIDGATSAKITTSDSQQQYDVLGLYDYNKEHDWAVIKVSGSGFKKLNIGTSANLNGGATVYTLGSPLGLQNTISQGLISNPKRTIDGTDYIQISAAISHGSSGGALLNSSGEVIGITSAGYDNGQNLNLAIPMHYVNTSVSGGIIKSLSSVESTQKVEDPVQYLSDFMLNYGTCSILSGESESLMIYTLEFEGVNGRTYSINYSLNNGYLYLSESYKTQFNDVTTNLYINGAGTNEYAAKASIFYRESPYSSSAMIFGFVYRDIIMYSMDGLECMDTIRSSYNPPAASDATIQILFYQMITQIISAADEMFAAYDLPIRMSDFGYV